MGLAVGFVGLFIFVGPGSIGEDRLDPVAVGAVIFRDPLLGSRFHLLPPCAASGILPARDIMEMLVGGALLAVAGAALGEWEGFSLHAVTPASAIAWTYLLVVGSLVGFTAYIWLLKVSTPARVSTYAYVNPVVAVFLGHVFAGETLTVRMLAGAAVILAAVAAITTAPASHAPAEPEGPPGFVEVAPALEPSPHRRFRPRTFPIRRLEGARGREALGPARPVVQQCVPLAPAEALAREVGGEAARPGGRPARLPGHPGGLAMRLDPSSSYERSILLNAADVKLLDVYRKILRPGDAVMDAGSNIGHLSLAGIEARRSSRKGPRLRVRAQGSRAPAGEHRAQRRRERGRRGPRLLGLRGDVHPLRLRREGDRPPVNGKAARPGRRPRDHDPDRAHQ